MNKEELLAKSMRERALRLSGYRVLTEEDLVDLDEELKKMYFNAGRWAGGSKDWTARKAYEQYMKREDNADNNN